MRPWISLGVISLALLAALSVGMVPAEAAIFEFNTSESPFTPGVKNQGWWELEENADTNDNYFAGALVSSEGGVFEFRNFFTFDLSSLTDSIISARLDVTLAEVTHADPDPILYQLFDVSTDPAVLNFNQGFNQAIFDDLGTGTSYGSASVDLASGSYPNTVLSIPLNAFAVSAINGSSSFFSIGGDVVSQTDALFGVSHTLALPNGIQRLVVETENGTAPGIVPEPASIFLLGSGLVGLAGLRSKARRGGPRGVPNRTGA